MSNELLIRCARSLQSLFIVDSYTLAVVAIPHLTSPPAILCLSTCDCQPDTTPSNAESRLEERGLIVRTSQTTPVIPSGPQILLLPMWGFRISHPGQTRKTTAKEVSPIYSIPI